MPRIQIYVPAEMYVELKKRDLPASQIFQEAVGAELARLKAIESLDEYLAELDEELGPPGPEEIAYAEALMARLRGHDDLADGAGQPDGLADG